MTARPSVFEGSNAYPGPPSPRPVVTIGNFDGVHRGHLTLVQRTLSVAQSVGCPAAVFTFHPPPQAVLRPSEAPPRIQRLEDRIRRLGDLGVDHVIVERFDADFAKRTAQWFAEEVLVRRLRAQHMVVGWDFRFGRGRTGSTADLQNWLKLPIDQLPPLELEGDVVSSSRIRRAVLSGDVGLAGRCLGRLHEVIGRVEHGEHRGRTLGFPTANVEPVTQLIPRRGVYAVYADVGDGMLRPAVSNIGVRPTFDGEDSSKIEVHILDFDRDLYDQDVVIHFAEWIRDERQFADKEQLVAQIHQDIGRARQVLADVSALHTPLVLP